MAFSAETVLTSPRAYVGSAYFYIEIRLRTDWSTADDDGAHIGIRVMLYASAGNDATMQGDGVFTGVRISGSAGYKYDSGWSDAGYVSGSTPEPISKRTAWYISGSGVERRTTLQGKSYTPVSPVLAPTAPTIGTNTRVSDTQNTISWTNNATWAAPYASLAVERSTNGGGFIQIATLGAGATSYTDTSTQPNSSYAYRIRATNATGSAVSAASSATYNTPSAPTGLSGVYVEGQNQVALSWNDNSLTESGYTIENADNPGFSDAVSMTAPENAVSATFSGVKADAQGMAYFRIRASRGQLSSAWSATVSVRTLTTPAPPTIVSPVSGSVLDLPASITFKLRHNSLDGSALESVVWAFSTDNQSWTEVSGTTDAITRTLAQLGASLGDTVYTKAKTKGAYSGGADGGYSAFSAVSSARIEQAPSISITEPVAIDGESITSVPVRVSFTYSDNSGEFQGATVSIRQGGRTLWSGTAESQSVSIPVAELLPENNQTYSAIVAANSTSGLSVTAERVFATDYDEPNPPIVEISIDGVSCSVEITVSEGSGYSEVQTVGVGLFRVSRDGEEPIAAHMESGSTVIDRLPPIDQPVTYRAVAYSDVGLTSQTLETVTIDSGGHSVINFGEDFRSIVKVGANLTWSVSQEHDRELFAVVGLRDPVERHTSRRRRILSASGDIWWTLDELDAIEALQDTPGVVWFREPKGHSIPCVCTVGTSFPTVPDIIQAAISLVQVSR